MYKKLMNKFHLKKLFILSMPKSKHINKSCLYLCKYITKKTPYGDINIFYKEILKMVNIFYNQSVVKSIYFCCTHKIYIKNISKENKIKKFRLFNKELIKQKFPTNIFSFAVFYNNNKNRYISFFKDKKIPSIGFINLNKQSNLVEYTILLESKFFCSLFLFYFVLKKIILKNDIK